MSFNAQIEGDYIASSEAVAERSGGGSFVPQLQGRYQAVVKENKGVEDFAKSGPNAGKQAVRLRVDILPDSPTGAKRVYFVKIPLFNKFAPTEKNPEGADAWMFTNFFERVMGVSREDIKAGKPLPSNVEGKRLTIILSKPKAPDQWNELGSNDVSDVDAPDADFSKTPIRRPGVAVAPWLTPDDQLIPDHPSLGAAPATQRQMGQGVPQVAWGKPAIPDAAPAASSNVTNLPQPNWGGDVTESLQQAAVNSGRSF